MSSNQYLLSVISILAASCSHQGVMKDVHVEPVSAEKVIAMNVDTTFHCTFPEVLNIYDIQIINDTVFTLMDQVCDSNAYHFKAYSTNSFEYLGAFIRKGRGPGEMMEPRIMSINSYEKHLKLKDNSLNLYCAIDVEMSIKNNKAAIVPVKSVSSSTFDWFPLPDSSMFLFLIGDSEMFFQVIDKDGNEVKTFKPYEDIDAKRYMTHFSSIMTRNGISGKVAEIMIFFPQVNIFDTKNGSVRSFAVNRAYRNWKSVISRQINPEMTQYYVNAASGTDHIFAAYKGIQLGQKLKGGHGTSIHVFDWDGNFKYDIEVREDIGCMTFDGRTKKLYCIENREGKIIRYDLAGLL